MQCRLDRSLQEATERWIRDQNWRRPFACTLSLKQASEVDLGHWVPCTELLASKNLRHFLNRVNRHCYGNASSRYGKRVPCLAVLEGGGRTGKRLHYHLMIDCPRDELEASYSRLLTNQWHQTEWGYREVRIEPCDFDWIPYILKQRSKQEFGSAIDWLNCQGSQRS